MGIDDDRSSFEELWNQKHPWMIRSRIYEWLDIKRIERPDSSNSNSISISNSNSNSNSYSSKRIIKPLLYIIGIEHTVFGLGLRK